MPHLHLEYLKISGLKPNPRNARLHPQKQLHQIAASIREFGFNIPVLIDRDNVIIAGHGRVEAARMLSMETVPVLRIEHLTDEQKRAFALADNKIALNSTWDLDILQVEMKELSALDLNFDVEVPGFETAEIDLLIDRTNVWDYAGVNTWRAGRDADLEMHPTVKPTALVIHAIKDCSRRGDIVLDAFSGSGTTIIAAHKSRRRAYAIELDPLYIDVAIRRWQTFTGEAATLAATGETFAAIEERGDPLQ